ncbi:MAG: Glyoxal reductase [Firmicutes bacterium ADurb.Bin300]|nr:MAG: Glyoxal reductase [Firmicutes bacterium ADurb.Bin300]
MNSLFDTFVLNNGLKIPCIGFGTWQTPNGKVAADSVAAAIKAGYRHIDTAAVYANEEGVGEGIRRSEVEREKLFVTTKLWNKDRGYENTLKAIDASLLHLGLDYVDLYLIHWPANKKQFLNCDEINLDTWRAMEAVYDSGKARAIGVSNFLVHHLEKLIGKAKIKPMTDQIEFHPGYLQEDTVSYCKRNGIIVEAYSPLGTGKLLGDRELKKIASRYDKSVAQLCIRFALQKGVLPLPKSVNPDRIKENADVFDFIISDEDMKLIENVKKLSKVGCHPDEVTW